VTHADAIIGIAIGVAAIVFGVKATEFYALGPGQRPKPSTKPVSRWFGKVWYIGIGVLAISWSLPSLHGPWYWSDLWADWWLLPFLGVVCVLNLMLSESSSEGEIQTLQIGTNEKDDPVKT
jgi:hypothetical protein